MLVYVGAEGLFELAFEDAVVSLRLQELNYGELDAWKGKEFFHTHIPSCLIFFLARLTLVLPLSGKGN